MDMSRAVAWIQALIWAIALAIYAAKVIKGEAQLPKMLSSSLILGSIIAIGLILSGYSLYLSYHRGMTLHWTMTQAQEEVIYGRSYRNEEVVIDGKKFDHCKFDNVTLMYHALAPADFVEATWSGNLFMKTDNDAAKGFVILMEQARQTMAQLPNTTFGIGAVDKNGNLSPLPNPSVRINK